MNDSNYNGQLSNGHAITADNQGENKILIIGAGNLRHWPLHHAEC